jgi:hypothetical protein
VLLGGCSRSAPGDQLARRGPKVNLDHFLSDPAAYQGKTITLPLTVAEGIDRGQGQSLRQRANQYVKFLAADREGERHEMVIRMPDYSALPDVAGGDNVAVTFTCTRGNLLQGNEATVVQKR